MYGGMRFTQEQIRALPLQMQEAIGLAIVLQMEKKQNSRKEHGEGNETDQRPSKGRTVHV